MTVFNILKYPHVLLRKVASPVERFTPDLHEFVDGMVQTMEAFEGIGLAAPQVGISKRIMVVDVTPYLSNEKIKEWHGSIKVRHDGTEVAPQFPMVLINPEVTRTEGEVLFPYDGCLSFPGASGYESKRAATLEVVARDADNRLVEITCDGIMSICLQHELDHLNGVLFVDRLVKSLSKDEILDAIEESENDPQTRKMLRKLKPVDARTKKYSFL